MINENFELKVLSSELNIETNKVLKQLNLAYRYLAELKGMAATIPNETILINTLVLQEAKDSSAIENIITTHDELYKAELFNDYFINSAAKEVSQYSEALKLGFSLVRKNKILTNTHILEIQKILEQNDAGYRKLPGTKLLNESSGETVYTPPQDFNTIIKLMSNLLDFINDDVTFNCDPLVKMAVMHYQFESIHPFYDGNGRTGRILNILFLVIKELLDLPILYLSRYIIRNKNRYYFLLQEVRENDNWEDWILYILKGVEETSKETIVIIKEIRELMQKYKHTIRNKYPKIYSQDLLNNLFRHPYTKIDFLVNDLQITRITAARYLNILCKENILEKKKIGRSNFYINNSLFQLFVTKPTIDEPSMPIMTVNPNY